jgi:hypothetical protein
VVEGTKRGTVVPFLNEQLEAFARRPNQDRNRSLWRRFATDRWTSR